MLPNRKILTLEQLLAWRRGAKEAGRTVVHCHGCFDLVHPGHIQHLEFARSLGDVLVVSVSADAQVRKGVDRPLIPQELRAANLAALQCVDAVYINDHPTAVELLEQVRPDVYVKGREYERNRDPRFLAERDTVMRHGGRVVFSSGEVVYSSTALIGAMQAGAFGDEKLRCYRERYGLSDGRLQALVQRFRGQRVLVIGDYVLDRYHLCDASDVAAEAPMLSLRLLKSEEFDGGAGAVAGQVAALGASAELFCAMAGDELSGQVENRLRAAGVTVRALAGRRRLAVRGRYVAEQSKLFEVEDAPFSPLDSRDEQELSQRILASAEGAAAAIFVDLGHGFVTSGLLERIVPGLRHRGLVLAASASGQQASLLRLAGMDLLCGGERAVRQAMHDHTGGLTVVAWNLLMGSRGRQLLVNMGKQGVVAFDQPGGAGAPAAEGLDPAQRLRCEHLPPLGPAVDRMGCDEALLATGALSLAMEGDFQAAALLGAMAAGLEAQQAGIVAVGADRLLDCIYGGQVRPAWAAA